MPAPTTRRQPASSPANGKQAPQRKAYNRRKTRAKVKSEALRQQEAAQVQALPVLHPHAAGRVHFLTEFFLEVDSSVVSLKY